MRIIDGTSALGPIGSGWDKSGDKGVTTVQSGERYLSDVAQRVGVDSHSLQEANPHLSETTKLTTGQEIRLPLRAARGGDSEANSEKPGPPTSFSSLPKAPISDPLAKTVLQMRLNQGVETAAGADDKSTAQSGTAAQGSAGNAGVQEGNSTDQGAALGKGPENDGDLAGGGKSDGSTSSSDGNGVDVKYGSTDVQSGNQQNLSESLETSNSATGETYSETSTYQSDGAGGSVETEDIKSENADGSKDSYGKTDVTDADGNRDVHEEETHVNSDGSSVTVTSDAHYSDGTSGTGSTDSTEKSDDSEGTEKTGESEDRLEPGPVGDAPNQLPNLHANLSMSSYRADPHSTDPTQDGQSTDETASDPQAIPARYQLGDPIGTEAAHSADLGRAQTLAGGQGFRPGAIDPTQDGPERSSEGPLPLPKPGVD